MKNRWLIAASAVGIHLSIGTIYAYSVLKLPLIDHYGWAMAVEYAFPVAIVFLGLSAAFMGHFVERYGPRLSGIVAGTFFGIGTLGAGLACYLAAGAVQPNLELKINSTEVQAALVNSQQSLNTKLADKSLTPVEKQAYTEAQAYLGTLITKEGTAGSLIEGEIKRLKEAKNNISQMDRSNTEALSLAQANKAAIEYLKLSLIKELIAGKTSIYQWLYLLCYGVLGGIGLGVGYVTPVSTLVKWFPDRRGLATGLAIMGFGFGGLIFARIMEFLMSTYSPDIMFFMLGALYLVLMLSAAMYIAPPPKDWKPKGWEASNAGAKKKVKEDLSQLTANEAIKTVRFYYLWLMLFINVTCGIALISVASPMAQDMVGMSAAVAATMVSLMGLFNGLGRIGWASASDYLGRANTYILFFALQIAAFMLLPLSVSNAIIFQIIVCLIITCYGGGFAAIPAFIGDLFGTKQLGAIHGYILTAWAAAGVAGPITATQVKALTGNHTMTLMIFGGLFIVALVIGVLMKVNIAQLRKAKAGPSEEQSDDMTTPSMPAAAGSA